MQHSKSGVVRARTFPFPFPSVIIVGIACVALIGWLFDSSSLKSVIPGLTAMNPMTAVAFMLGGISLWLLPNPKQIQLVRFLSLGVVAIGAIKIVEILFGVDVGVDRLLFADRLQADSVPNRMAPNTAVGLLLVGAALVLTTRARERKSWSWGAQILALLALLVAFLATVGYVYEVDAFYGVLTYIPMALNTAVAFLLFGLGILAVQPETGLTGLMRSRSTSGMVARRLMPTAVSLPLLLGWLRLLGQRLGLYDTEFGVALFSVATTVLLLALVWWTVRLIDRTDQERVRSAAALRQSEARYRALFENSSDAIVVVDSEGTLLNANPQMERVSGYSHDELTSISIGDLVPGVVSESGQMLADQLDQGGTASGEYTFVRSDGSEIVVEYTAAAVASGLYQSIFHDISERKKAEEQLRQALEDERYLNELKNRFVSMVSHEFRTPLAVIRSSTDLLLNYMERTSPEKVQERLEKIQREVSLMVQMLDDILILRRAEQVGADFHPQRLDLRAFCDALIDELQPAVPSHRIRFTSTGDCSNIAADPKLLRQAITNMVTNAVKYSPEREEVHLDLVCGEREIIVHVRDQGIGIPAEDQERLFEVFHRASNVGSISGTGLGLPIIKMAVEAHGGSIAFASEENVGTTFTISFPRSQTA